MINREALVRRHCPVLTEIDAESPLSVGNGEFAFTADITGFQTLYDEYEMFPLCTMSQWGWHTSSAVASYTFEDLEMTRYCIDGKEFSYASLPQPGNEHVYNWLRHNPHRLNLARISLLWDGNAISANDITEITQKLDLYNGILSGSFSLHNEKIKVQTICAKNYDILAFSIDASPSCFEKLSICISFPYGSHLKNASDWESPGLHKSNITQNADGDYLINRILDNDNKRVCSSFEIEQINKRFLEVSK